jgi:hypothetical protein
MQCTNDPPRNHEKEMTPAREKGRDSFSAAGLVQVH